MAEEIGCQAAMVIRQTRKLVPRDKSSSSLTPGTTRAPGPDPFSMNLARPDGGLQMVVAIRWSLDPGWCCLRERISFSFPSTTMLSPAAPLIPARLPGSKLERVSGAEISSHHLTSLLI